MNYRWRKSSCKGKNDPHTLIVAMINFLNAYGACLSGVVKLVILVLKYRLSGGP
jgi:hypothetical protein